MLTPEVFLPDAEPREISAPPHIAEEQLGFGRICEEESLVTRGIHKHAVEASRGGLVGKQSQVFDSAVCDRLQRPLEIVICAERAGLCARRPKLCHSLFEERRTEGHVLCPGDWPIEKGRILHRFSNEDPGAIETDAPFELKLGCRQEARGRQFAIAGRNLIRLNGRLAVHCDPGRGFFGRRRAEQVETEVVPHDPGEKLALGISAVLGMLLAAPGRRLDGWPGRNPQWIDTAGPVQNLRDVAAFGGYSQAYSVVLNLRGAPIVKRYPSHLG